MQLYRIRRKRGDIFMAVGLMEVLAIIGLVVGIFVAARTKKISDMSFFAALGLWWTFGPALEVVTDILSLSSFEVFGWLAALVSAFGLGAAVIYAFRSFSAMK